MNAVGDAVEGFGSRLSHVDVRLLAAAVLLHLAGLLLRATAWRSVLGAAVPGGRAPWRPVTAAYLAGAGVNAVVPARGGDVARVVLAGRAVPGLCCATAASGLVVESMLDVIVAGGLLLWAVGSGALPLPAVTTPGVGDASLGAGVLMIAGGAAGIARRRIPARRLLADARRGLRILASPRAYALRVAAPQLAAWGMRIAAALCFLHAFHITASPQLAVLALLAGSVTTIVPLTPGGVGPQQALLAVVLAGVASPAAAISYGLGTQLAVTVVNVVLGGACMGLLLGSARWRRDVLPPAPLASDPT